MFTHEGGGTPFGKRVLPLRSLSQPFNQHTQHCVPFPKGLKAAFLIPWQSERMILWANRLTNLWQRRRVKHHASSPLLRFTRKCLLRNYKSPHLQIYLCCVFNSWIRGQPVRLRFSFFAGEGLTRVPCGGFTVRTQGTTKGSMDTIDEQGSKGAGTRW